MKDRYLKTTFASPEHREGLVVILSLESAGVSNHIAEFYYEDKIVKIEIYQNAGGWISIGYNEFKTALDEAEDKIRNQIIPY